MAVTRTSRFNLHRWDSGGDPMNRAQFDIDNLQVETLAAIFRSGPDASRPAAGDASNVQSFYAATDTGIVYCNNNGTWVPLNDYGEAADISAIAIGNSAEAGSGTEVALANHVHSLGTPSAPAAVSTTAAAGSATVPARGDHVHSIGTNAVTETTINAGAVTEAKIGTSAVTEAKIGTSAVTEAKIGTGAVTEAKIGTGAVTPLKIGSTIAGNGLERNVSTGVITVKAGNGVIVDANGVSVDSGGITAGNIADNSISTAKLQDNAVTSAKIATDAVTPLKISSTLVGNGLSRNGTTGVLSVAASTGITVGAGGVSVTTGGITDTLLASNSVTEVKINAGAVTEAKIGTAAVTPLKIASTIVGTGSASAGLERNVTTGVLGLKIGSSLSFDGTTGAVGIAANGVTSTQIASSAVTPLKIDASIVGNGLTRNVSTGVISVAGSTGITVGAGGVAISTGGVTADLIADGAVTTAKLLQTAGSQAVTTATLRDAAVTTAKLDQTGGTQAVSTATIRDAAVTEAKIASSAVTSAKLATSVAGTGLSGGGGSALSVNVDYATVTFSGSNLTLADGGVTSSKAGYGVYANHMTNSGTSGQKIRYTAESLIPLAGSAATGYAPGDLWFGF